MNCVGCALLHGYDSSAHRLAQMGCIVHACVIFSDCVFQVDIFGLCSFLSSLCIVPASGVDWKSLFLVSNHCLLVHSQHQKRGIKEIDQMLVLHHLNSHQFPPKSMLYGSVVASLA